MKKYKFTIGNYVDCSGHIVFYYDEDSKRKYTRISKQFRGFITGMAYKKTGRVEPECGGIDDYEPAYFITNGTIRVWLVRETLTSKEMMVLEEDIQMIDNQKVNVPVRKVSFVEYFKTEKFRAMMKEEMASWPRDNKGRWTKLG